MTDCRQEFCHALLRELVLSELSVWRKRKVEQITPLNRYSYRARTSYQFSIPSEIIQRALVAVQRIHDTETKVPGYEKFGVDQLLHSWPSSVWTKEFDIILPVTLQRKQVLLDFSITGADEKPIVILNRYAASSLTLRLIEWLLSGVSEFLENNSRIIRAIIFLGLKDLVEKLKGLGVTASVPPQTTGFLEPMSKFLLSALERFLYCETKSAIANHGPELHLLYERAKLIVGRLETLGTRPLADSHHPIGNPLMCALDYFKLHTADRMEAERLVNGERIQYYSGLLSEFIGACVTFLDNLLSLDNRKLTQVCSILDKFSQEYVVYGLVSVRADRDFLIKMEQVVPTSPDSWLDTFLGSYQEYPVVVGDSQSVHVEITCQTPTELEQDPAKTEVRVGGTWLKTEEVFGYSAHSSKFHQHFYTTKSERELRHTIRGRFGGDAQDGVTGVILRVKYRVERTLAWTHVIGAVVVAVLTGYFGYAVMADRVVASSTGQSSRVAATWVPALPAILAVWALLARLRARESIVAERLQPFIWFSMACAVGTNLYLGFEIMRWVVGCWFSR